MKRLVLMKLVPFQGRNDSGVDRQNFLWRHGSIYVMDNHRAAMWCWLQHIDPCQPHSLFHMDRHYDCLPSPEWLENCPEIRRLSINEYLNFDYAFNDEFIREQRMPLFRWDNYLSIYLTRYQRSIGSLIMYTHDDGAGPQQTFDPGNIWSGSRANPLSGFQAVALWIFNLDLDYFFWHDVEQPGLMSRCRTPTWKQASKGSAKKLKTEPSRSQQLHLRRRGFSRVAGDSWSRWPNAFRRFSVSISLCPSSAAALSRVAPGIKKFCGHGNGAGFARNIWERRQKDGNAQYEARTGVQPVPPRRTG